MMLICIYCGRVGHRMVLDTDLAPPVTMCEEPWLTNPYVVERLREFVRQPLGRASDE